MAYVSSSSYIGSPIDEVHRHGIPVRIKLAKIDLKDHHPIVADLPELGLPSLSFGVGLHYGEVVYGNVGWAYRLDFTVMGVAVNRTARFESLTK
ncbi:adenylate/guanylate cyclase domain-containing protein [Thalassospira lucentensis]|uniref:adenylate/guanylate cyclase domain-containing protein n=1 Tax=Thalassospira lucentensis TaxID=168935 RepID=UPI003AA99402